MNIWLVILTLNIDEDNNHDHKMILSVYKKTESYELSKASIGGWRRSSGWVSDHIPSKPTVEQRYGTYFVNQGVDVEPTSDDLKKIEKEMRLKLNAYLVNEKNNMSRRFDLGIEILKSERVAFRMISPNNA